MLDHIEDPHNFGAIIRTCEAAGVDGIIIPKDRACEVNSTVIKVSTGAIENIDISDNGNRVIFTDGEEQLIVEDGEFFLVSSTDSLKTKKKKKREEARNMYIEYFIRYQLNPIINQRKLNEMTKTISQELPNKNTKSKEIQLVKKEIKDTVKNIPDKESKNLTKNSRQIEPNERTI